LRLLSRWALTQPGVARLQLSTSLENTASQRVAERSGFQREGVLRSYNEVDGCREDAVSFSLLLDELDERPQGSGGPALAAGSYLFTREILDWAANMASSVCGSL
jgi:hypothetical protein